MRPAALPTVPGRSLPPALVGTWCLAATVGTQLGGGTADRPLRPAILAGVRLFHITTGAEADRLMADGVLEPPSLAAEGFVHCSTDAQVVATTTRWFPPEAELVLVELDPDRLGEELRWPEVYPGQRFPHVHGPLRAAAVVTRLPWGPADRAAWPAAGA